MNGHAKFFAALLAAFFLVGCDGGMQGDYSELNVRWRREIPPKRSDYSSVIFSRKINGAWSDCLAIDGTDLFIKFIDGNRGGPPSFVLTTGDSRVVVLVQTGTHDSHGATLRNLGLNVSERRSGIVFERKQGEEHLLR